MASITAVTDGVKTPLLKKMERRATAKAAHPTASASERSLSFGAGERALSFPRKPLAAAAKLGGHGGGAKPLDEALAFSIICRERVVDFYAPDAPSRT
eukprot:5602822-Prymnesium_polylepis.1